MILKNILKDITVLENTAGAELDITGVCCDSRKVKPGDLFVAVRGYESDGHRYIPMAVEKGCAAVLCEEAPGVEVPYVVTDDSRLGLALAARNFYRDPSREMKIIGVTGTNGKTTTARMLEEAFCQSGKSFFANRSGANLISGITTEFVMNSSLFGKMRKEYAVIECDEAAARRVFAQMQPRVILVTNLFTDQPDRFGDVTNTRESIREAVRKTPDAILCLNADCSLTASIADGMPNPVVTFGMEASACEGKQKTQPSDADICIRCGEPYTFDYVSFDHLGGFRCPGCGFSRPRADVAVQTVAEASMDHSTVLMNAYGRQELVRINLPAVYNIYNAAAALAAAEKMGLNPDAVIRALSDFHCGFGRMEQLALGKQGARMMLVKNPAGCNQVLSFLQGVKENFVLVIALNDKPGDGTDISWIHDTDFESLCSFGGRIRQIVVSGIRAKDLYARLEKAGISPQFMRLEQDYDALVRSLADEELPIFIMPNYTAMLEMRQVIVKHCGGANFWE